MNKSIESNVCIRFKNVIQEAIVHKRGKGRMIKSMHPSSQV